MIPQTTRPAPKPPKNVPAMMLSKRLQKKQKCMQGRRYYPSDKDCVCVNWLLSGAAALDVDVCTAATTGWAAGAALLEDAVAR